MNRIICVGNSLVADDAAGWLVGRRLAELELPPDVEVVDGGLAGLGLLTVVEGAERVVFVDAAWGVGPPGTVRSLDPALVASAADPEDGHGAGLPYLLRVLPAACQAPPREIHVVGLEPPWSHHEVEAAARLALELAVGDPSPAQPQDGARCPG